MFSRSRAPAVSVYPDSDKIGVSPGDAENDLVFRRGSAVPWSEVEEGAGLTESGFPGVRLDVYPKGEARAPVVAAEAIVSPWPSSRRSGSRPPT